MFLCVYWSPKPKKLKVGDYCTGALEIKDDSEELEKNLAVEAEFQSLETQDDAEAWANPEFAIDPGFAEIEIESRIVEPEPNYETDLEDLDETVKDNEEELEPELKDLEVKAEFQKIEKQDDAEVEANPELVIDPRLVAIETESRVVEPELNDATDYEDLDQTIKDDEEELKVKDEDDGLEDELKIDFLKFDFEDSSDRDDDDDDSDGKDSSSKGSDDDDGGDGNDSSGKDSDDDDERDVKDNGDKDNDDKDKDGQTKAQNKKGFGFKTLKQKSSKAPTKRSARPPSKISAKKASSRKQTKRRRKRNKPQKIAKA
jgi:hypothetical protein